MKERGKNRGNPVWNLIKAEWAHLGNRKKIFGYVMGLFVIAGLISLAKPLLIGMIFNKIQQEIGSVAELKVLLYMISLLFVIEIFFWMFHGSGRIIEERVGFMVTRNYTNSKIKKVLQLPLKWHKDHHSGDTIDKINRSSGAVGAFSMYTTFQVVYAVMNIFGSIIVLLFVDYRAAIIASVFSVGTLYMITRFDKKLDKQYIELNKLGNKVSASIFDYISNIVTVITLRLRKSAEKEIDHKIMASWELKKKNAILNELKWGLASVAISVMIVIVLSWKAYRDFTGTGIILIGTLYILYGYLGNVGRTFHNFAELYGQIVTYDASIYNVSPIDKEFDKLQDGKAGKISPNWKGISLRDVSFSYDNENSKFSLDKVNVKFKKGDKIALVGESGSGKSTILTLMRGLNDPKGGSIYYNGMELKEGFSKIKKITTLVPQDPEIFNNTIKYNITLGIPTKREKIGKAIKLAQFEKVVNRLDKGLETNVLEKGVSLSGGEKQRLALARGILAAENSDILLMDEPTSSVDSTNEIKIYDNILKEFRNKTVISSIHRLHLLKKFDYIYIFDKGKIVAEGTLSEIRKNPQFKKAWEKYHEEKGK